MVYYFTSNAVTPSAFIYVGKDKFENEELIAHGWEEDFHVDNLSSAHVYLRLRDGETWDAIPPGLLQDCIQLTKANSIEGNKKDNITVIYTPHGNLKKDGSMAVGQVSFKDPKKVKKALVVQRENAVINRLNKTKVEKTKPDLRQEKEDHLRELRKKDRIAQQERARNNQKQREAATAREHAALAWQKDHAYDELFGDEEALKATQNWDREEGWEDDFM
ncbi:MAG: hypothetical protein M1819_002041 [Sarea resinae]|nr:MAG: hypothetical protein M1819_002041 [Sarea resinae]